MPRYLIACDKFKGSLSADAACAAIRRGLEAAGRQDIASLPIADGGEGLTQVLVSACGGSRVETTARDPLGRVVPARYGLLPGGTAVIEMAEASGLWRLKEHERDPWRAGTAGTGDLIRHAAEASQASRILLGLGGSATNDGGTGMATALGVVFHNEDGAPLDSLPEELSLAARLDLSARVPLPPVVVACDVTSPLLGPEGCTQVFGRQKGILPRDFDRHEARLQRLAGLLGAKGEAAALQPGSGAAGGLGFGSLVFLDGALRSGFDLVAEATGLEAAIRQADIVITGEGRLDSQTVRGKGPAGVAALAKRWGKRVVAFAGAVESSAREELETCFGEAIAISPPGAPMSECAAHAETWLAAAVQSWASRTT